MSDKLKRGTHYIVEIKLNKNNCLHRTMMYTGWSKPGEEPTECTLYCGSYEAPLEMPINKIFQYKIISELEELKII